MAEGAGPRLGDAASLWNFSPSPGWSKEEVVALKLALEKFGVGRWVQIVDSGVLPGKLIQQLNGQTQRLLGQQSLAAFTGLHVDTEAVRRDNEARQGPEVVRKGGLIINSGGSMTKAALEALRQENQKKYGLSKEHIAAVSLPAPVKTQHATATLERQAQAGGHRAKAKAPRAAMTVMTACVEDLSRTNRLALLAQLHARVLKLLCMKGAVAPGAPGPAPLDAMPATAAPAKRRRTEAEGALKSMPRKAAASKAGPAEALVAMGFSAAKAADALAECQGDVESAVAWLFANGA